MLEQDKASQQPTEPAGSKRTEEITYPDTVDLEKEGNRRYKKTVAGEEKEITLKEAFDDLVPKGYDYTKKTQKIAGLFKKYGTEDIDELIDKVKAERDGEYIKMAGDPEYHKDFMDVFAEAGFELKINKKGEEKVVNKETGHTLTPEELENLDPQTKKILAIVQAQNDQIKGLNDKFSESDKRYQSWIDTQIDKQIQGEIADLKAKNPDVTDSQVDVLKTLSAIDTRMSMAKAIEPKTLGQIYEEMKQTFGSKGKEMSEQDISAMKAKWLEELKHPPQPQVEGAGKGSPAPGEPLPQNRKELYDRLRKEGVPVDDKGY